MNGRNIPLLMIEILMILGIISLIMMILREIKSIRFQKRFDAFSLASISSEEKAIADNLNSYFWDIIHKISKIIKKSKVLQNYGATYEKHIIFEEKEQKSGIDYISIKILTGTLFILLDFIASLFQSSKLGIMSLLLAFLLGFFLPDLFLTIQFKKKRKRIEDDLLKSIIMMNNSFKAGRNIMQAVEIVKNELDGPISDEFKKIYMDMNYGLSVEVVFNRFYERVKLEEAKYITSSLSILNKTGGNIVKVFATIEKSFFDRKQLLDEMKSLTSASIFLFRILVVLPFLFVSIIYIMNPTYFSPFFETPYGFLLFLFILILYGLYILFIKKVLKVRIS